MEVLRLTMAQGYPSPAGWGTEENSRLSPALPEGVLHGSSQSPTTNLAALDQSLLSCSNRRRGQSVFWDVLWLNANHKYRDNRRKLLVCDIWEAWQTAFAAFSGLKYWWYCESNNQHLWCCGGNLKMCFLKPFCKEPLQSVFSMPVGSWMNR